MPFLASLLREQKYLLHSLYSGLPATTPAFQGEFFYGVPQSVPAWSFREKETGQIGHFLDPAMVARREAHLKRAGTGLLAGGSAFACLLSGGASEVHFCTGKERWLNFYTQLPPLTRAALAIRYLARLPRVALAMLREAGLALCQALATPSQLREQLAFLPKRIAINVAVRRYLRAGIGADLVRGVPVIYGNFLDYDCHGHLAGPHSAFARQTLRGIDETLRHIWGHAQASGRRKYHVWIFSDHGQQPARPFSPRGEGALAELLKPYLKAEEELIVADNGPLAHLYLHPLPEAARLEELAHLLVKKLGVPQIVYRNAGTHVVNRAGSFKLPHDYVNVLGEHLFAREAADDLVRLSENPEAGTLMALGWGLEGNLSFARERGGHAGPGPEEIEAFALLPEDVPLSPGTTLRALTLREAALKTMAHQA